LLFGDRSRLVHTFRKADLSIGRGEECDIVLVDDAVSRVHARAHYAHGDWILRDVGSSQGTYVARRRIRAERVLRDGEEVRFGDTLFKFVSVGAESYSAHAETAEAAEAGGTGELVGGWRIRQLAKALERLAGSSVNLLLVGEPGTEKE